MVHWKTPEYADIAFAELNAATLGVKAMLHFESSLITDSTAPRIGGLVGLEREHKLKFKIVLPSYRDEVSAYRWHLIVHRYGDGEFPEFTGGELILTDEYHASYVDTITRSVSFSGFAAPRWPDYKAGLGFDKRKHVASVGEGEAVSLEISGVVELMPTIGSHSIVAATLLLMYWPDRNIDSAYVEVGVFQGSCRVNHPTMRLASRAVVLGQGSAARYQSAPSCECVLTIAPDSCFERAHRVRGAGQGFACPDLDDALLA